MKVNRAATIRRDDTPAEEKPFRIAMASSTPCDDEVWDAQRCEYCRAPVVLKMDADSIDLRWIEHGVPVLIGHPHWGQCREAFLVARAESPYISDDGKLCSDKLVWSDSEKAQSVRSDVEKGVITDLSIECDYNPDDTETERGEDGRITRLLVTRWRPLAVAFVVNGADPASGVNRSINQAPVREARKTPTPNAAQAAEGKNMDKETMKEAIALARQNGMPDGTVEKWIDHDADIAAIRREVLDYTAKKNPPVKLRVTDDGGCGGITIEEARNYSFLRAIRALADKRPEQAETEWAVSQKLARALGREPQGMFLPLGLRRAMTTAINSGSGLVGTDHLAAEFIDALRARSVLSLLGVRYLDGLVGDVSIPKKTSTSTAYWVAEHTDVSESEVDIGQVALTPHTAGTYVDISRKLLKQSSPAADAIVEDDILDALALAIQNAVLNGSGTSGQPTGIFATAGVTTATVSSSGNPTWAEITAMQGALDTYGIDGGKWVVAPTTFSALRALNRATYGERFVADIVGNSKFVADEPAFTTSQLSAGKAIYGSWGEVVVGMWGALDVKTDDCSLSKSGGLRIVGLQDVDIAVRHPEAFVITDKFPTA